MHVPVFPTLPQSLLPAGAVAEKFRVATLGGLGCDATIGENVDMSTGECLDGTAPEVGGISAGMGPTPLPPLAAGTTDSVSLDNYFSSIGLTVPPGQPFSVPTTSGQRAVYINQGTAAAPNYAPAIGAAVQGAIDIAKLLTVQPGTVQQGGTTIRQNPGFGVPTPYTSTSLNLGATGASSGMLIAVVGLGAVLVFSMMRKS